MKLTYSAFLLFAAVTFYYAQAASLTRDIDDSGTSHESLEDEYTTGNYSEVQKQDDETQETHYETDVETGVEEHTTVRGERAEQVTATMNVTTTTSKESDESDESTENKDRDTARQKRQHPVDPEYQYSDYEPLDNTE